MGTQILIKSVAIIAVGVLALSAVKGVKSHSTTSAYSVSAR